MASRRLRRFYYFDIIGNMKSKDVVPAFAALAQETRLAAYRMLVQAGPEGVPAGEIAGRLGIPPATASFHLSQLTHAGLIQPRTQGRFVIYSTDFERMNELVSFLTDNCCGGQSCAPACSPTKTGDKHAAIPRSRRR